MSIHKKLQDARVELQSMQLKKSGQNKFAGYSYYELGDFLPQIQELCQRHGLCPIVSFSADTAQLDLVDYEDGSAVSFTSPMGSAALKGCHEVQNVGAVETYQRRYLYQVAFEIVEHDALDAVTDPKQQPQSTPQQRTPKQIADEIKAEIEKLNDPAVADGFKNDARAAWDSKDPAQLEAVLKKVRGYEAEAYKNKEPSDKEIF